MIPARSEIHLRKATADDVAALRALYAASVEALAPGLYNPDQIAAWSGHASAPAFAAFILDPLTLIAHDHQQRVGFCGIEPTGHIASLYVHPEQGRRGIATTLLCAALDRCPMPSDGHWSAEASLLSRPVFARCGFAQVGVEQTEQNGVRFERFLMRRDPGAHPCAFSGCRYEATLEP